MVNSPIDLYTLAEQAGIDVIWFPLQDDCSLALHLLGRYAIAIDPWKMDTVSKETVSLAHELGHCQTGSFYNEHSPFDIRQRHENRADRWAIQKLIPKDALDRAVATGYQTAAELADYFGVTESFLRKAICLYTHGNLADSWYAIA